MKHVRLAEARAHIDELLDEVARGETLMISPEGEPITQVGDEWPTITEEQRARSRVAMEQIEKARKTAPRVSVEEILAWRDEGRKY